MLIKKYTADWVKDFEDLKQELEKGLHGINCQIEHIGSTSVPGLDAKAIIDLDIIYENQGDFEQITEALIQIGY